MKEEIEGEVGEVIPPQRQHVTVASIYGKHKLVFISRVEAEKEIDGWFEKGILRIEAEGREVCIIVPNGLLGFEIKPEK